MSKMMSCLGSWAAICRQNDVFARQQLIHLQKVHQLASRLLADLQDLLPLHGRSAGDGQVDLIDIVLLHPLRDVLAAACNDHAVDGPSPLVGVIIDEAAHLFLYNRSTPDVPQDYPGQLRVTCKPSDTAVKPAQGEHYNTDDRA